MLVQWDPPRNNVVLGYKIVFQGRIIPYRPFVNLVMKSTFLSRFWPTDRSDLTCRADFGEIGWTQIRHFVHSSSFHFVAWPDQ